MKILVTGCAGFIGFHLSKSLIEQGHEIIGIDNLNDYYDQDLKRDRLEILKEMGLDFKKIDLVNEKELDCLFNDQSFEKVVNMAAQAGVRYSIENPKAYIESNIVGFTNLIEISKKYNVKHFIYASSSSVYGKNTKIPFSTEDTTDHPISLYAATKKSNELIAHTYSHLFNLPTTGLRFFTVYGPWGRPDMAYFSFTKKIFSNEEIKIFNNGKMSRDFTYIDDLRQAIENIIFQPSKPSSEWNSSQPLPNKSDVPFRIYNIGNNHPVSLLDFIHSIEKATNKVFKKSYAQMQPGDVKDTYAQIDDVAKNFHFMPKTKIQDGINNFVAWYKDYYDIKL